MDNEQACDYTVHKTNNCSLNSIDEPKNYGNPGNNWQEEDFRFLKFRIVIQNMYVLLIIQESSNTMEGG